MVKKVENGFLFLCDKFIFSKNSKIKKLIQFNNFKMLFIKFFYYY